MDGWTAPKMEVEVGWANNLTNFQGLIIHVTRVSFFFWWRYYEASYAEDENIL